MKEGDKIRVIETGRVGVILAVTGRGYKVDFQDGNKPEFIGKEVAIELVIEPKPKPHPHPQPRPKKKINWVTTGILIGVAIAIIVIVVLLAR